MKLECKRLISDSDSVRNYVNYLNSRAYVKNTCANMHIPEHNSLISIKNIGCMFLVLVVVGLFQME